MKNLEQIRAANAIEAIKDDTRFSGANNGEVVKKIPAYIKTNGLLGAAAFAYQKEAGYETAFEAIIAHLKSIGKIDTENLSSFLKEMSKCDSAKLRDVTEEALAYLNYLRRFAKK